MGGPAELKGPDLTQGVPVSDVGDGGVLLGHAHGEAVMLARRGEELFAVGATCTHYSGPLAEGLVVGDTVRCPWHHACFSLRTGAPLRAPALNPIPCFAVEKRDGKAFVGQRLEPPRPPRVASPPAPGQIVIIGAGAAGNAAAETLRREGYLGRITMIGDEDTVPYDRPNLSKDYLAGNAPEEWIPLRPREFYDDNGVELVLGHKVARLDVAGKQVHLADGRSRAWDALLLATGAEPIRLPIPGADLPQVHLLRSLADSRAIIAKLPHAVRAVVVGASFIGLEAAASLRARNVDVHVVAPESVPLERVMGREMGAFLRKVHEEKGVVFHLGLTPAAIDPKAVTLSDGQRIAADLVVMGVGVRPRVALAEQAGLAVDRGVLVNQHLETSVPGIWAAGDIARWPDPHTGAKIRVEHWVVAERHGQTAARNMLGVPERRERFDAVPFFWSMHYDVGINYVGHAESWDETVVDGSFEERSVKLELRQQGKTLAVATIFRDADSLAAEAAMEAAVGGASKN
jgi:apoptosis-inducing factor 3